MNMDKDVRGGTLCMSKAGLKIGSTATQIAIAAPNGTGVDFAINGTLYYLADTATVAVTASQTVADGDTALLLVCLDSSGTVSTVLGDATSNTDITAGNGVIEWPQPTADTCAIGALKVKNASGADFITGTTAFNATSITTTYIDLLAVPTAPLAS